MNYSPELKEALLRRMLPPNNESIPRSVDILASLRLVRVPIRGADKNPSAVIGHIHCTQGGHSITIS